jgi:hypothetical protein
MIAVPESFYDIQVVKCLITPHAHDARVQYRRVATVTTNAKKLDYAIWVYQLAAGLSMLHKL